MNNETQEEIIARNVAQWRKDKETRLVKTTKTKKASKKKKKNKVPFVKTERSSVRHDGVAFDAIKEALEDAIEQAKK